MTAARTSFAVFKATFAFEKKHTAWHCPPEMLIETKQVSQA
jgi:hypothetical protein